MEQIARLIDADSGSLDARVMAVVANAGTDPSLAITRFTYWYTARPPVHEAIVLRRAARSMRIRLVP